MAELPGPLNPLELRDNQTLVLRVLRHELGETVIFPPFAPNGKRIKVLRVHVPPEDKPDFPHYYDITPAKLYAQLLPEVQRPDAAALRFTITAHGFPPKKSFTVERVTTASAP